MLKQLCLSAIAAAALVATSAVGQTGPQTSATPSVRAKPKPATTQKLPALSPKLPNTVHEGGRGHKYLGRDPNPEIRYQIMKDEAIHKGNN
jgi:hypothetical protein